MSDGGATYDDAYRAWASAAEMMSNDDLVAIVRASGEIIRTGRMEPGSEKYVIEKLGWSMLSSIAAAAITTAIATLEKRDYPPQLSRSKP